MNSFITGSRVYGTPTEKSDIDLCVMLEELDYYTLNDWSEDAAASVGGNSSLRFGRLNLIVLSASDFEAWREATDILIARKPVTKKEAIAVIEAAKKRRRENA